MTENYIQSVSIAKLAEYDQSRIDLPIRKYVLIANLLREDNREQDWFDACLDDLEDDEDDDQIMSEVEDEEEDDDIMSDQEEQEEALTPPPMYDDVEEEEQDREQAIKKKTDLHLFYNLPKGAGFIVCTSTFS